MYIAESYGMLYRFSKRNLILLCKRVAAGEANVPFLTYGTPIGNLDYNFTDLDQEQAKEILEALDGKRKSETHDGEC